MTLETVPRKNQILKPFDFSRLVTLEENRSYSPMQARAFFIFFYVPLKKNLSTKTPLPFQGEENSKSATGTFLVVACFPLPTCP